MLGTLRYLYTGSKNYAADRAYYLDVLGAELIWEFPNSTPMSEASK